MHREKVKDEVQNMMRYACAQLSIIIFVRLDQSIGFVHVIRRAGCQQEEEERERQEIEQKLGVWRKSQRVWLPFLGVQWCAYACV